MLQKTFCFDHIHLVSPLTDIPRYLSLLQPIFTLFLQCRISPGSIMDNMQAGNSTRPSFAQ